MINVKAAVLNKSLTQTISRVIRTESINEFGEPVISERNMRLEAVITTPTAGQLQRYTDATNINRTICVTTAHPLNPDFTTGQPDIIEWAGNNYIVVGTENYINFGYTRAICQMVDFESARTILAKKEQQQSC